VAAHQALQLAQACGAIEADSVNALDFPELVAHYGIRSVPHVVINERVHFVGAVDEARFVEHVLAALAGGPAAGAEPTEQAEGPASGLHRPAPPLG
jgi:predicted DsbA family dithiol-disulfide isomerase